MKPYRIMNSCTVKGVPVVLNALLVVQSDSPVRAGLVPLGSSRSSATKYEVLRSITLTWYQQSTAATYELTTRVTGIVHTR